MRKVLAIVAVFALLLVACADDERLFDVPLEIGGTGTPHVWCDNGNDVRLALDLGFLDGVDPLHILDVEGATWGVAWRGDPTIEGILRSLAAFRGVSFTGSATQTRDCR